MDPVPEFPWEESGKTKCPGFVGFPLSKTLNHKLLPMMSLVRECVCVCVWECEWVNG